MANIPIWDNNPGPAWGNTPFGFYDNDLSFQQEAPLFATWAARRLGYPVVNIELQDINFYACFEEAITTYGNEVYQYKVREGYLAMEGNIVPNTVTWNNKLVTPNLGTTIRIAENYASEAGVGGYTTYYTGSLEMTASVQNYDLNAWAASQGISGSGIEIKKIFFEAPPAIVRYFDPYAGTGTGIQSLLETFGFGQMSPGINFMLMPISFDALKLQAIELNDQIRKSAYSFDLVNNQLRIFPVPDRDMNYYFEYVKLSQKNKIVRDNRTNVVTDIMNVPYRNPIYMNINTVGRLWIFRYTSALCKLIEGEAVAKLDYGVQGQPYPKGGEMLSTARTEIESLINELKEMLNETSRRNQLERKQLESQYLRDTLQQVPLPIYIL